MHATDILLICILLICVYVLCRRQICDLYLFAEFQSELFCNNVGVLILSWNETETGGTVSASCFSFCLFCFCLFNSRAEQQDSKLFYFDIREIKFVSKHIPHHNQRIPHIRIFGTLNTPCQTCTPSPRCQNCTSCTLGSCC